MSAREDAVEAAYEAFVQAHYLWALISDTKDERAIANAIRICIDRINNSGQALLGCAAALEGSGGEAGGK